MIFQIKHNWINETGEVINTYPTDIEEYNNIFDNNLAGKNNIKKLSIKAPQGTQFKINNNIFTIGTSGTFMLNKEDYKITQFNFIRPINTTKNEEESNNSILEGLQLMDEALTNLLNQTKATIVKNTEETAENINLGITINPGINIEKIQLPDQIPEPWKTIITNPNQSSSFFSSFLDSYINGFALFRKGIKGIYQIDPENPGDINNILIDIETY